MGNLTATAVQQAKGGAKAVKMQDGEGLYLLVNINGSRYWRYNYRFAGKRKTLALGVYPGTILAAMRKLHQEARETLAKGIDPSEAKRIERITRHLASADSFEALALEWYEAYLTQCFCGRKLTACLEGGGSDLLVQSICAAVVWPFGHGP